MGVTIASIGQFFEDASNERAKFYPDGVPGYEEIGDTAYITFDSFATMPAGIRQLPALCSACSWEKQTSVWRIR